MPSPMRPHPHLRTSLKWAGTTLSLLLISIWILNGKWGLAWTFGAGDYLEIDGGFINIILGGSGWSKEPAGPHLILHRGWWWDDDMSTGIVPAARGWCIQFHMLPPTLLALAITIPAWILDARARRRIRAGLCRTCRYDRATLPLGSVCPECGSAKPPYPRA